MTRPLTRAELESKVASLKVQAEAARQAHKVFMDARAKIVAAQNLVHSASAGQWQSPADQARWLENLNALAFKASSEHDRAQRFDKTAKTIENKLATELL